MINLIFKTVLSMSVSGALLIIILFLGKCFLKNRLSRQWQYYVWLIVVFRLLLPFGPEISLMEKLHQTFMQLTDQNISSPVQGDRAREAEGPTAFSAHLTQEIQKTDQREGLSGIGKQAGERAVFLDGIGLLWLLIALGMLIRKVTAYQSFVRYVSAGAEEVSDLTFLEALAEIKAQMGVDRRVELCVNPLLSSPTLTGIFRLCIVLPSTDVSPEDFRYIVFHELVHGKRWDILYKWLVQIAVCLHWFNPLAHLMSREIEKACEFSCDEAVVAGTGYENARDYGKTLLDSMAAVGKYRETPIGVSMNAGKELLKERLGAIMSCGKKSGTVRIMTAVLTVCIISGAVFVGIYPTQADVVEASEPAAATAAIEEAASAKAAEKEDWEGGKIAGRIEAFYEAGNLPGFQLAFGRLDEDAQGIWLDKIYKEDEIAFFSEALGQLEVDSFLIRRMANKTYADGSFSFFSVLADHMEEDMLEEWLDRATADQEAGFQSILFDRLGKDEEKNEWEEAQEKKQMEEYRAVGVTKKGKNYYYQGQLVNVFLDLRPNASFYTLNINPKGTVNVKILRGEDGQITGAAYLTEDEFRELFGDMGEALTEEYPRTMYVNCRVCMVRAGAGAEFAVVGMMSEEEEVTVLELVEGDGGWSWYRIDKESLPEDMDISEEACYIRSDLLREK